MLLCGYNSIQLKKPIQHGRDRSSGERVSVVVARLLAGAYLQVPVDVQIAGSAADRRTRIAAAAGTRADRILRQAGTPALAPRVRHQPRYHVARHLYARTKRTLAACRIDFLSC